MPSTYDSESSKWNDFDGGLGFHPCETILDVYVPQSELLIDGRLDIKQESPPITSPGLMVTRFDDTPMNLQAEKQTQGESDPIAKENIDGYISPSTEVLGNIEPYDFKISPVTRPYEPIIQSTLAHHSSHERFVVPERIKIERTGTPEVKPQKKWIRWSQEEDELLKIAVSAENSPPNWRLISLKYFHGERSHIQCKNRWKKVRPDLFRFCPVHSLIRAFPNQIARL